MAKDVLTVGHLTCVGATAESSRETIKHFEQAGVSSILALRGDAPQSDPQALATGEMKTALDLVELASMQHDAKVLRLKQDAGASFAMTQLFFSVEAYLCLVSAAKDAGSVMPIVPGLMPISNSAKVLRMAQMSGAEVPPDLLQKLENASESEARIIGMDFSVQLANDLLNAGAPGLHIFTLNYSKAALEVARGCGLA
jgi:methylenetetrahydrofolate reductase (NADPH)